MSSKKTLYLRDCLRDGFVGTSSRLAATVCERPRSERYR